MAEDFERCYAAVRSRDPRFDGWLWFGVTSTGIYCRPSCAARTPSPERVRFFPTAAAAHRAGFRACKRCRPDTAPGSPAWDLRADLVGRALRLIGDGVVDREGVDGLARRLGYSPRHVHRQLVAEVGAGPLGLARAQRAATARLLIETTALPLSQVAFAAGFSSVRQFNDTVRAVFGTTPGQLRRRLRPPAAGAEVVTLRLAHRHPADLSGVVARLRAAAVAGLEAAAPDGGYRRSLALHHGGGVADLRPADGHVVARLDLEDLRDLPAAVQRCRRLLDLDADPAAIDERLAADPQLRPLVLRRPGARVAGSADAAETAVRTALGRGLPAARAAALTAALLAALGQPLRRPGDGVTHRFPAAADVAAADLAPLGIPPARAAAVRAVAAGLAEGAVDLGPGADRDAARRALAGLPGLPAGTAQHIAQRALGDPDAFPSADPRLRRAAAAAGLPGTAAALLARAEDWRPWRAYAAEHLRPDATSRRAA